MIEAGDPRTTAPGGTATGREDRAKGIPQAIIVTASTSVVPPATELLTAILIWNSLV
jgi:hypothetical protein